MDGSGPPTVHSSCTKVHCHERALYFFYPSQISFFFSFLFCDSHCGNDACEVSPHFLGDLFFFLSSQILSIFGSGDTTKGLLPSATHKLTHSLLGVLSPQYFLSLCESEYYSWGVPGYGILAIFTTLHNFSQLFTKKCV